MSTSPALNTYHILCSVGADAVLMRVPARNSKEALTTASRCATNLIILFATRDKATH